MALAIGLCLILLTITIAISTNTAVGPMAEDDQTNVRTLEAPKSAEGSNSTSESIPLASAPGDDPTVEDPVQDPIEQTDDEAISHGSSSSFTTTIVKKESDQSRPPAADGEQTAANDTSPPALPVANLEGIRVFADPASDRIYIQGTIRSPEVHLGNENPKGDGESRLYADLPIWGLTITATGTQPGSGDSDPWLATLRASLGEVRPGGSQEFALRSPRLKIDPQDFVDLELTVNVGDSTITRATAFSIAWESQDRPPMPPGGYLWERPDFQFGVDWADAELS